MVSLQPLAEIEHWYEKPDPWQYEDSPDDLKRKSMLLSVLPQARYGRILDIGCGDGFITRNLPGDKIIGVDISENAIKHAKSKPQPNIEYQQKSLFDLGVTDFGSQLFDLVVITGLLYPQYIGMSQKLAMIIIDELLPPGGHLVSCHIDEWYAMRFPYITLHREYYPYREFNHLLEVYLK